jgi:transcriptional regulator with XRE-family HTH domain
MRTVRPLPFPAEPHLQSAGDLGAAIRSARTASGLSIPQAAAGLGISKQTLQDLEHGKGTVGLGVALRAATQLGVALFMAPAARKELVRRRIMSGS